MENLITLNQKRWNDCHISADKGPAFKAVADRLSAPDAKVRYQAVEKRTGVPWWFVAVVHEREASQRWDRSLAQGDPWNKKSTHVPANRGPFNSWEDAAYDALVNCAPFAARNKDWSVGNALTMLEKYNGLGYYKKGIPSPYIWAGTDQYTSGKYIADGKFDANAVDQQLGCAGLLKFMGIGKTSITPSPSVTTATIAATVGGGAAIGAASNPTYWHMFQSHWILYTVGIVVTAIVIDLLIHAYKNGKQNAPVV